MKKGVIIFSIDDGRYDMYRLAKDILIPRNLPATFNITTDSGYSKVIPSIKREELLEVGKHPLFEIANHSDMHTNEFDDIRKGYLKLCDWFGFDTNKPIGFASPGSGMSPEFIRENIAALNEIGVKYVRTCRDECFNKDEDSIALTSFAVTFDTPVEKLKELADTAAENKYCLIYLLHSVFKEGDIGYNNTWSYDYDKFIELADYIAELSRDGKIDVMTTMDYVDMQLGGVK